MSGKYYEDFVSTAFLPEPTNAVPMHAAIHTTPTKYTHPCAHMKGCTSACKDIHMQVHTHMQQCMPHCVQPMCLRQARTFQAPTVPSLHACPRTLYMCLA